MTHVVSGLATRAEAGETGGAGRPGAGGATRGVAWASRTDDAPFKGKLI